ncbi:MAG TPA: YetF domain-containing protein [Pseudoduganella sp.]
MFDMDLPWWEFMLRAVIIYAALLVMVRLSGKRTVGQFTPFDLLVVMLLSESVSPSLSGGDDSISGALLLSATLIMLNVIVAVVTARSSKAAQLIEGSPVLLGRDGRIFEDVVRRAHVAQGDVEQALRENDCPLEKMKYAFLEADGKITIQQN